MTKLIELQVSNVPPFKEATLKLDHEGITVIHGLNKDAGNQVSNAAGKSALMGALAELVLDESPSGKSIKVKAKRGKKVAKERIRVKLESHKNVYDVTKTTGKGKDYEILKNGKATNSRTVAYNQKKIESLVGLSDTQFYSRLYIDSTIPHPLFSLKAAARQDYIVELFELNDIDSVRKLLNAELSVIVKKAVELRTIHTSIDELRVDLLPKEQRKTFRAELEELLHAQSQLTNRLQASQAASELMSFERQHQPLILELKTLTTLDNLHVELKSTRSKYRKMQEQKEAALEWKVFHRANTTYLEARRPVKLALKEAGVTEDQIKSLVAEYREVESELRMLERQAPEVPRKPEKVEEPKHPKDKINLNVARLEEELEHTRAAKGGKCPTCGQKVKARPLDEVQADLQKWSHRMRQTMTWESYTRQKSEWTSATRAAAENEEKSAKLQKKLKRLKVFKTIQNLLEDVPVKPREPRSEEPADFDAAKLDQLQKRLQVLQQGHDMIETLMACQSLSKDQREKASQSGKFLSELNSAQSRISELTSKLAGQDEIRRRLKSLKERAAELEIVTRDEKLLKGLIGAYSTQGLKKFMIARCAKRLEEQCHKYRKIFFEEDFEFEFRYDSKLDVIVHRKYGKKVKSSGVQKLSGAEKRMFTLLLVVSTITLLPAHKRLNVLILDEPEANMGAEFVDKLIRCLPLLQKLVPHILFVTPRTELQIPNSRVLTVVKQNGVASLQEGDVVSASLKTKRSGKSKE